MNRFAAILVAAAAAAALASCAKRDEAPPRAPRLVSGAAVERRDFSLASEYPARLVPAREINITPKVGGRVSAVLVEVGMTVAEGQELCRLDASDFEAQYRQAKAALDSAQAGLTRTSDSGREQQTLQAKSASDQARIAYDEAKKAYDRMKRLYDAGSVSRQQFEEVEARFKAAGIQRDAADSGLALVQDKAGSQANEIAAGQVEQARAQVDLARSQLDGATVTSPIAGRISYRGVEAGEFIGTSTLAFVVIDESEVIAEAGLSERVVGSVRKGLPMQIVVPAVADGASGSGRIVGRVDSVSPAADPRTMLYALRLLVPNPDGRLKGGMLARVRVPLETRRAALLAPERSTFSENGSDFVMVAKDGTVARRRVSLGESDGASVEILDGLAEGELVVTAGQEFLGDGDRVSVAP